MRSLKSLLGSALLQDKTAVHQQLISYQDAIISLFLAHAGPEGAGRFWAVCRGVVMGRPAFCG